MLAIKTASTTATGYGSFAMSVSCQVARGPDHHELPEGEIYDAGDAERHRHAQCDDPVERSDDNTVQQLTDDGTSVTDAKRPPRS